MSDSASQKPKLRSSESVTAGDLVRRVYLPDGEGDAEKAINAAWTAWGVLCFAGSDSTEGRALRAYVLTYVLDAAAQEKIHAAALTSDATGHLDKELFRAVREFIAEAKLPDSLPTEPEDALYDGVDVLPLDETLARFLERIGECGRTFASDLRDMSRKRTAQPEQWRRWVEWCGITNDGVLYRLAMSLWADRVGPRMIQEARKPAALVVPVFNPAVLMMGKSVFLSPKASGQLPLFRLADGSEVEVWDRQALVDGVVPTFSEDTLEIMKADSKRLSSLIAIRLFHWAVLTAHRQKLSGINPCSTISVDGGAAQIAKLLDVSVGKGSAEIMAVLRHWDRLQFKLPNNGKGSLISLQEYPAAPGRKARVDITLSPPMLPDYVRECKDADRKLVPLPTILPPLPGASQDHAACAVFSFLLIREMRLRAKELVLDGGILLHEGPGMRAIDLADQAGLRRKVLPDVLERWQASDNGLPSFLETNGRRVIVREPIVKGFLLEAGTRELGGAKAGRRSAEQRAARLEAGLNPTPPAGRRKPSTP